MSQTLQELLTERVAEYANSHRPTELIDAGIDKMFKEVVEDAFRGYGDFGKAVKDAVKLALPANVSDMFELTRYNALVANALKQRWEQAALESTLTKNANKAIDEVLRSDFVSGEVSLRGLLNAFIEEHKERATEERWESPEIRFEYSNNDTFLHIYFDPEPESEYRSSGLHSRHGREKHSLSHSLSLHFKGGLGKTTEGHQLGEPYAARLDNKRISTDLMIHTEWERMLASIYFGNALVSVDCEPDDFDYGLYD